MQRPSDGAVSDPSKFEYKPAKSGRYSLENLRRMLKRSDEYVFQDILKTVDDKKSSFGEVMNLDTSTAKSPEEVRDYLDNTITVEAAEADKRRKEDEIDAIIDEKVRELEQQERNIKPVRREQQQIAISEEPKLENVQPQSAVEQVACSQMEEVKYTAAEEQKQLSVNDKINEWMKSNELQENEGSPPPDGAASIASIDEDKVLTALLDEAAELDEIYTRHVLQRDTYKAVLSEINGNKSETDGQKQSMEVDDSFDDAATYSSLQRAFKNPIHIPLDDLMPPTPPSSQLAPEDAQLYDRNGTFALSADAALATLEQLPIAPLQQQQIQKQRTQQTVSPPRPLPPKYLSPHMHVTAAEEEKLPPLPPKRIRKQDGIMESNSIQGNINIVTDYRLCSPAPIIIKKTPDHSPLSKRLPSKPVSGSNSNTLPKQKKSGFFSKIFSRRKSRPELNQSGDVAQNSKGTTPNLSRESSISQLNNPNRGSVKSLQPMSLPRSRSKTEFNKGTKSSRPVGRSVSSVSGKRPTRLTADVIHIPLKGDSINSLPQNEEYSHASTVTLSNTLDRKTVSALQLADIPICEGNMELVAIADRQSLRNLCEGAFNVQLDPDVDLTEAEHFALYTSIPPQATTSEFDEASAYYAAVDAGEILTPDDIARRLAAANCIN